MLFCRNISKTHLA